MAQRPVNQLRVDGLAWAMAAMPWHRRKKKRDNQRYSQSSLMLKLEPGWKAEYENLCAFKKANLNFSVQQMLQLGCVAQRHVLAERVARVEHDAHR